MSAQYTPAAEPRARAKLSDAARVWRARAITALPIAVATILLARATISGILTKVGHAAATLDDSYIHFQYARAIAEWHPFRFQAGEPLTSGATSILWPVLLAPFYALGMRDEAILWPAWAMSFLALGLLAHETFLLTKRLTGAAIAAGAAAMVLCFTPFAWYAASGMEVVPFAWSIARAARRASEWSELDERERTRGRAIELIALAWVAALFRPEGAIAALFVAATLITFPRARTLGSRALGLTAGAAALATPLLLLALTGTTTSNTTLVKLMVGNPYYQGDALFQHVKNNASLLVGTLLNGEQWSAEFLPKGGAPVAMAGLVAILVVGWRRKAAWRSVSIWLIAILMFAPCFYVTFLWNRLRYLWPFATGWIIGVACLARVLGDVCGSVRARWRVVGPLAVGLGAGVLLARMDWVLEDVSQSASGIDRQQVALGRWAKANLPLDARIGVNDTGAIAYFSDRRTFDIVGLTSEGEARYWVAGAGSRLEHYERLHEALPQKLPTHFIVYPEWMACDAVLGERLHEASVYDSSILGGQTMRVYVADYARLGSGEKPWTSLGEPLDTLDVADLESEAQHRYELLGARDGEQVARSASSPDGHSVVDGGRTQRTRERFIAKLPPGSAARGLVRLEGASGTKVRVSAGGADAGSFEIVGPEWGEYAFALPASATTKGETVIELVAEGGAVTVFHYWFAAAQAFDGEKVKP